MTSISFLSPLVLFAFIALPFLWLLIKLFPPQPKRVELGSFRLLRNLKDTSITTQSTPWWLLLLRLTLAGCIILALAQPVINKSKHPLVGQKTLLVIDNSWASAPNWADIKKNALNVLNTPDAGTHDFYILTTTYAFESKTFVQGPLTATDAKNVLKALTPQPWPISDTLYNALDSIKRSAPNSAFIFSSGLKSKGLDKFLAELSVESNVTMFVPESKHLPVAISSAQNSGPDLLISVLKGGNPSDNWTIQLKDKKQRILEQRSLKGNGSKLSLNLDIESLQGVQTVSLSEQKSAGATLLLLDASDKAHFAILSTQESVVRNLSSPNHYMRKAIEPFADITQGSLDEVLSSSANILVLPDVGGMPIEELIRIEEFTRSGGILLRFAGHNMLNTDPQLVPVDLRAGGRALEGALSWETPLSLAAFSKTSPFYGLNIPDDVTISRQILAEPGLYLDRHVWATLEDGTPIITARNLGDGLLVMVHTTASPDWSNLVLSGLFVDIMKRIAELSHKPSLPDLESLNTLTVSPAPYKAIKLINGFGKITEPDETNTEIDLSFTNVTKPSTKAPPGLYSNGSNAFIRNISDGITGLAHYASAPSGGALKTYTKDTQNAFMPALLMLALCLICLDILIVIMSQKNLKLFSKAGLWVCLISLCSLPQNLLAAGDANYANGFYLAYISSGNVRHDAEVKNGLENLKTILFNRTSVEPDGVIEVDLDTDELAYFPLLYWKLTPQSPSLSAQAYSKLQTYLDNSGTVFIDVPQASFETPSTTLKQILAPLNIPPLMPVPEDHVLTKSFYLLNKFSGIHDGTIWIESNSAQGRDGVSSVIIGSHGFAESWASPPAQKTKRQEMAYRFGVNLIMYALTGNYKADQVHIPLILQRLGR